MDMLRVDVLDLDAIPEAARVLRQAYGQIYPKGTDDDYLEDVANIAERIHVAQVFGCWLGEQVIGSVTLVADEQSPLAEGLEAGEAGIRMLGVAPEHQGRGAGHALVSFCCRAAEALGKEGVLLHTDTRMRAAQHLYERLGFVRESKRDMQFPGFELLCYRLGLGK